MKSTDEMILDLHEKAGFVLPEGLKRDTFQGSSPFWRYHGVYSPGAEFQQQVHDLCAMGYARQARAYPRVDWELWCDCMIQGDSAAAIRTLWKGVVCDEG